MISTLSAKGQASKKGKARTLAGSLRRYARRGYSDQKMKDEVKRKVAIDAANEGTSG